MCVGVRPRIMYTRLTFQNSGIDDLIDDNLPARPSRKATRAARSAIVCVMMCRSEMQVVSVNFWRCAPICVHEQAAEFDDLAVFSRANERADSGPTHQPALSTSYMQADASAH